MNAVVATLALLAGRPQVAEVITAPGDVRGAVERDGAIWLATAGGLIKATPLLDEEARFTTRDGLPSNDLRAIASDGEGLAIATARGLIRVPLDGGWPAAFAFVDGAPPAPPPAARRVWLTDRILECGPDGVTLRALDGTTLAFLRPVGLPSPRVTALRLGADGLLVDTARGLALVRPERASQSLEVIDLLQPDAFDVAADSSEPPSVVWSGRTWQATAHGLAVWHEDNPPLVLTLADGLPGDSITALVPTPDGLWVATDGGLARVVLVGGSLSAL